MNPPRRRYRLIDTPDGVGIVDDATDRVLARGPASSRAALQELIGRRPPPPPKTWLANELPNRGTGPRDALDAVYALGPSTWADVARQCGTSGRHTNPGDMSYLTAKGLLRLVATRPPVSGHGRPAGVYDLTDTAERLYEHLNGRTHA